MTGPRFRIAHPTDFSEASEAAFAHALRLAVLLKAEFDILHVHRHGETHAHGEHAPAVRETLARWGLIAADAPREAVEPATGVTVYKVDIRDHDASAGVHHFIERRGTDLLVLGTERREGLDRIAHGSVAEKIAALVGAPALVVPHDADGFVDSATGAFTLSRVLVPVAAEPNPAHALKLLARLLGGLGVGADQLDFVHVGEHPPAIAYGADQQAVPVRTIDGPVIDAILDEAEGAVLIVMATRKHDSLLDRLRGTHTERVLRQAPCPVLAIPA